MITVVCSLQFSHEFGLCKNNKISKNFKLLDALNFRHLDSVYRPSSSIRSRYNVFVCQSSLIPIRAGEVPILKTAATALTRSYDAFHGNPFLVQLIPGFVIIAFAIWGLAPLVRRSRNLFVNCSDNSWKRSGAHFITSSYIQPLLLWTGITLVCRAFDPVVLQSVASQSVKTRLLVFVRSISTVLALAYCLSSLTQQVQQYLLDTSDSNNTKDMGFQFVEKAVHSAVWVAAVSLFMELLGFSTQKMLTAGGLGTVLLTLAGREIFTNFLSSLMIHATRPFVLNEWIQTKIEGYEVSGTVEHVGWWSPTIIRADDREAVHIPNHKFTVNIVRNLSQKTHWRIKTYFSISHLDVNKINLIVADMRKVLAKNPQVEQQKLHRRVFFERIDPENQALVILVSCFVKTSHIQEYFCVKEAVLLDLLRVISHHRARLATPIRTVQKMNSDEDMENIPFSESVFSSARPATNRPFLLIEPSYKINGDDKTRVRSRSAPNDEEQDTKVTAVPTDDPTTSVPLNSKEDSHAREIASDSDTDDEVIIPSQSEFDDTMVATTPPSDSKVAAAAAAELSDGNQRTPTSMVDNNVAAAPLKSHKLDRKVASTTSGSNVDSETAETKRETVNRGSDSPGGEKQNRELKDAYVVKTPSLENPQGSGEEKGDHFTTSQVKQETEKLPFATSPHSQSILEDNIVLGVALDGSRRTLPIEEDMDPTPPAEMKELEACGSSAGKNKSEDHTSAVPGDERDR